MLFVCDSIFEIDDKKLSLFMAGEIGEQEIELDFEREHYSHKKVSKLGFFLRHELLHQVFKSFFSLLYPFPISLLS